MNRNKYFFSLFTGCRKNSVFRKKTKNRRNRRKSGFFIYRKRHERNSLRTGKNPRRCPQYIASRRFLQFRQPLLRLLHIIIIYIHTYIRGVFRKKTESLRNHVTKIIYRKNGAKAQMKSFPTKGRFQNESYI